MTESATPRWWWSGDLYEPYVGRWSRLVAREFLAWLDAPAGLSWLDVGCGTGALAEAIVATAGPDASRASILRPDFSTSPGSAWAHAPS